MFINKSIKVIKLADHVFSLSDKQVGDSCDSNSYCPSNSDCVSSKCACDANFKQSSDKNYCVSSSYNLVGDACASEIAIVSLTRHHTRCSLHRDRNVVKTS